MPYQIYWEAPDVILCIKLFDQVSMQEFIEINEHVNFYLDEYNGTGRILLKIDALEAQRIPQGISHLKSSQTYADRYEVKWLLVVGNKKSIRLIMLLTFNLSRALLQFADNHQQADRLLKMMSVGTK